MRSEEPAALAADYAALAARLGLPEADLAEQKLSVEAVRNWLGHHGGWLLVFDNARTRAEVIDYLPRGATGHVIITSRDPNWSGVAQTLQVPVLPLDQAIEFLLKRTSQTDTDAAAALATALGRLPLALEQAGAYIDATGGTLAEYARLFDQHHQSLLSSDTLPANYPAPVVTTWNISFEEVRQQAPAAEDFVNLGAFLAPDDIPLDLITEGAKHLPDSLAEAMADPIAFNKIIAALRRYSLIERSGDAISIHRLVQLVLRDRMTEDSAKIWAEAAVQLVNEAFPSLSNDVRTWPICLKLLPHSLVVIERAKALRVASQSLARLLNQVGLYLDGRAEFDEAKNMYEQAIVVAEETYGADHPEMAIRLSNLGVVLRKQGDLSGARANIERALKIDEAAHGSAHPMVAIRLNNLGAALHKQGDLDDALTCYRRALTIIETAYNDNHPTVAVCLSNLALVLSDKGDFAGARLHIERALWIHEAEYGSDHPDVALDLNNLAFVLVNQGDLAGARGHLERALDIFIKFLGENHPNTLTARNNLAALENRDT